MPYLELRGIRKSFGPVAVVQQMDLAAEAGEFIVLVGASGCGKSTTLRMIAGLETPSAGAVVIDGRDVTRATPAHRDIAMVFQNYALYPHMNVAQNMGFALELAGATKADIAARVHTAAEVLAITPLLKRLPKELSGGQRQRVAMGRAIVREPKVFLFDEPLSNLDAKLRGQMRVEIALLHRRLGKTTVYVTHDQVEAMTLATRIVVMDEGRIQQVGSPDEVFNRPHNRFVAGFIGSPAMNFLEREGRVLGVRPQALHLEQPPADAALTLSLQVQVCEYLGTESVLSCLLEGESKSTVVVVATGKHSALVGQRITAWAEAASLYHFEPGAHGRALH
jgi:ABC-type sugar transport system ATPase subunit